MEPWTPNLYNDTGDGSNGRYNLFTHNCGTFVNAVLGTCNINKRIDNLFWTSVLNFVGFISPIFSPLPPLPSIPLEDLIY